MEQDRRKRQKIDVPYFGPIPQTGSDSRLAAKANSIYSSKVRVSHASLDAMTVDGVWCAIDNPASEKQCEFYLMQPQCSGTVPSRSITIDVSVNPSVRIYSFGHNVSAAAVAHNNAINTQDSSAANVLKGLEQVRDLPLCEGYHDSELDKEVFGNNNVELLLGTRATTVPKLLAHPFSIPFLSTHGQSAGTKGTLVRCTYRANGCSFVAVGGKGIRCQACHDFAEHVAQRKRRSTPCTVTKHSRTVYFRFHDTDLIVLSRSQPCFCNSCQSPVVCREDSHHSTFTRRHDSSGTDTI